jgi:hypothetical protein
MPHIDHDGGDREVSKMLGFSSTVIQLMAQEDFM